MASFLPTFRGVTRLSTKVARSGNARSIHNSIRLYEAQDPPSSSSNITESYGHGVKRPYPLYPSVIQLLHVNGISESDAAKIPTTGPGGRLLKGDVLAYMGSIEKSYPKKQSERLDKLAKLDLSNINISAKDPSGGKAAPPEQVSAASKAKEYSVPESAAEASIAISLSTVTEVQQRISKTLGIDIPLAEFVARAVTISNTDLPAPSRAPTADELFYEVLGISEPLASPLGHFNPQILTHSPGPVSKPRGNSRADVFDILTGVSSGSSPKPRATASPPSRGNAHRFSVNVPKGEEARAKIFLERLKTILQSDPGRLVL